MSDADNGGPAFPQNDLSAYNMGPDGIGDGMGMALRDYFAGQALVGFLSNPSASVNTNEGVASEDLVARSMYVIADAMLAARKGGAS